MTGTLRTLAGLLGFAPAFYPGAASADPPPPDAPLIAVEANLGEGIEVGGGGGSRSLRAAPLRFSGSLELAVRDWPRTAFVGNLFVESDARSSLGLAAGVRVFPGSGSGASGLRVGAGAIAVVAPDSLYGVELAGGYCLDVSPFFGLCGDLQIDVFAAGSDLPDGRLATVAQVALGARFALR